ncbi:carbamoyltransferase family protein [Amycolatopsis vastitatis]|uniref:Carbamoyltransferase n=1 Tax=Amycolatopsis vastitatis TaxID=1905142 RepID=A0A229SKI0_9PSEU|nr:carbamoyltransferase C-terminal domain-containing protein [Amycolatopsis vastitatis]OXM59353.1 carbamoyltransferase [Amycolatopsis vastitatis]
MIVLGYSGVHGSAEFTARKFPDLSTRSQRFSQGYDSAAAIIVDGGVEFAIAEERLVGRKATGEFPVRAIELALDSLGLTPRDIHTVSHGFNFRRHKAYDANSTARERYDEVYSPQTQVALIRELLGEEWNGRFQPVEHHLAHAASAFYQSGFDRALVVVADGMGEQESLTVATADRNGIVPISRVGAAHSLGVFYSAITHHLGFVPAMDEYKVMGLAPYGDPARYIDALRDLIIPLGSYRFSIPLLAADTSERDRVTHASLMRHLGERIGSPRQPGEPLTESHADLAASLQAVFEENLMRILENGRAGTGMTQLCLAGGSALNCTMNSRALQSGLFDDVFVPPGAGDDGTSVGAALFTSAASGELPHPAPRLDMPYWGPAYPHTSIRDALLTHDLDVQEIAGKVAKATAERLSEGELVGWFQGRAEFGPRALGNRSILAEPSRRATRDRLNSVIKEREQFRPFAPMVTAEHVHDYFRLGRARPEAFHHMLFVAEVHPDLADSLAAVIHVDGTARVQVVTQSGNPLLWELLTEYAQLGHPPILLNTSFNLRGQPIVTSPQQAVDTFCRSQLDRLVIGPYNVRRRTVPKDSR